MQDNKSRKLFNQYTSDDLSELLAKAAEIGINFVTGHSRSGRVLRYASEQELVELFAESFPENGIDDHSLLCALNEVARWSVSQHDQRYLAFPDTGSSVANLAAGIVSMFLNQNLIAFDRSAPAGSVIEVQVINWLRELVGYSTKKISEYDGLRSIGGMWTSGGNMSNHVAIAVALASALPEVRVNGLVDISERPVVVLASGVEHFSYLGAAQVMGLGSAGMLWTAPTEDHTSDVDSIAAALETPPHGTRPFMVVGVAGNCRTTGIDDLNALANLCEKHKVWFHVDACHGGSLLFSNRLRKQISGIERADSISLDPHKGLFVTYPSSYLLVRDPSKFAVFSRYADKVSNPNCMDLGLITPFYGSRGFDSLRLWAVIKHMGRAGISTLIESRQETFNQLRAMLENLGFFTMLGTSEFYRCAFVFCPKSVEMLISELITFPELRDSVRMIISLHTKQLCEQLYKSGEVVFDLFSLHDLRDVMGCGTKYKFDVMGMSVGHAAIDTVDQKKIAKQITILAEQQTKQLVDELVLLKDGIYPEVVMTTSSGPAGW